MASVKAKYQFLYIDIGMNGRISDGGVLQRANFFEELEKNELRIPNSETITGTHRKLPFIFLSGDAFRFSLT